MKINYSYYKRGRETGKRMQNDNNKTENENGISEKNKTEGKKSCLLRLQNLRECERG